MLKRVGTSEKKNWSWRQGHAESEKGRRTLVVPFDSMQYHSTALHVTALHYTKQLRHERREGRVNEQQEHEQKAKRMGKR